MVSAFISSFEMVDSSLTNLSIVNYAFKFTSSNATISNCIFSNINSSDSTGLFQASFQSIVVFSNLTFTNSTLLSLNNIENN